MVPIDRHDLRTGRGILIPPKIPPMAQKIIPKLLILKGFLGWLMGLGQTIAKCLIDKDFSSAAVGLEENVVTSSRDPTL